MNTKRNILYTFLATALLLLGCTKDFEEINTDPNNPLEVSTSALMTSAQKSLLDDIRDEWFSGRQSYLYAQYFAQRNYTEEDRYQIRQTTNNTYWRLIYTDMKDLQEIIRLNTDPATKSKAATYGNSDNQIAAARILKAWAFQILTDTYGDIPYFEALQGETILTPAYTPQQEIYADLIKELTEASAQLNLDEPVLFSGDVIYGGDAGQWKKFANSLKMRVALRMSKVNPDYKTYINEALAAGVFESNEDNAVFTYLGTAPNNAPLYDAYFTAGRNDITLAKPFVELLKGENDVLNNKNNPFNGLFDPRLELWARPVNDQYTGLPYGILNNETQTARAGKINMYAQPTIINAANAPLTYMDYAEVCFILSEVNGFDESWYKKGVEASLEYWGSAVAQVNRWSKDHCTKSGATYLLQSNGH
jgi:hypothetical protein